MTENVVSIGDEQGHRVSVHSDGSLSVLSGVAEGSQFYVATLTDAPGVIAANNFLSVFNPVGSGKTVVFYSSLTVPYATAATSTAVSMTVLRTTAATNGTLVAANTIGKFVVGTSDPVAEVRINNPTVTATGISLLSTPPPLGSTKLGASASAVSSTAPGASFVCTPGQGIAWRTTAGETAQSWNIQVVWAEF